MTPGASPAPMCGGGGQPRAAGGAAELRPAPLPRDPRRLLTRQSAAAASVARVPLPPLQDEVGVGPLGDPQRVGQQHLLWVHPHGPRRRGRTHNGAAGRLLHTPARTGAHPRAHARPPARPLGAAAESGLSGGRPAAPGPPQSPRGRPGTTARTRAPRAASSPPRCRLPRARGRRRPGPRLRGAAAAHGGGRRGAGGGGSGGSGWAAGSGAASGFGPEPGWGAAVPAAPTEAPGHLRLQPRRALEVAAR